MAQKTRAEILTEINTLLADNTTGAISAEDVRSVLTDIKDSFVNLSDAGITTAEAAFLAGVTSAIQTQIDAKQATIDAANRLNANLVGDGSVDNTEFSYINGVTSAIQTQLDAKADLSGAVFTGEVSVVNSVPVFKLNDTSGATNEKKTNISSNQGALRIQHISDANSGGGDYSEFLRSGNNMTAFVLYDNAIAKITLNNNGTATFDGAVTIGDYTLPATDGTIGQVLKTDGAGSVTWQSQDYKEALLYITQTDENEPTISNTIKNDFTNFAFTYNREGEYGFDSDEDLTTDTFAQFSNGKNLAGTLIQTLLPNNGTIIVKSSDSSIHNLSNANDVLEGYLYIRKYN